MNQPHRLVDLVPKLLALLESSVEPRQVLYWLLVVLGEESRCESAAVRWKAGEDYPYYVTRGFAPKHVLREQSLCDRDAAGRILRDSDGRPRLACLCGAVAQGKTDSAQPYFTEGGSFWTNCLTALLESALPSAVGITLRSECHREGYESIGLIPLRAEGERYGLLQLNSRQTGRFTIEQVLLYEGLAEEVTAAVADRIGELPMSE